MKGKVYLVGAGPGDAGLLTLKGKRLLQEADDVVYDRLVSREILEMIPRETRTVYVGKNPGHHPVPQNAINEILCELAEKGHFVVRLKGGDPLVFGRGGEELEALKTRGIPFEVVPGISSAMAVPEYAGIPLTHREYSSSLHIISGHRRGETTQTLDYDALVRLGGTLVFLMSVSRIEEITEGLMAAGMDPGMPAAVIENGTRPDQREFTSALGEIAAAARRAGVQSPAILLVGEVAALSNSLNWYEERPLRNRRILVTQPEKRISRLRDGLRQMGAEVLLYPAIRMIPRKPVNPPVARYDVLAFTSAEGVEIFFEELLRIDEDSRCLSGKRIACIGSGTASGLLRYGIRADFVPEEYNSIAMAREMLESGFLKPEDRLLLLRSAQASREMDMLLDEHGIDYLEYPLYDTVPVDHEPVDMQRIDLVTFTSRSTVKGFVKSQTTASSADFHGAKAVCIGAPTAEEARKYGFETVISERATIESMLERIRQLLGN